MEVTAAQNGWWAVGSGWEDRIVVWVVAAHRGEALSAVTPNKGFVTSGMDGVQFVYRGT